MEAILKFVVVYVLKTQERDSHQREDISIEKKLNITNEKLVSVIIN